MEQSYFMDNWDTEMRLKLNHGMYSTLCIMNVVENVVVPLMFA